MKNARGGRRFDIPKVPQLCTNFGKKNFHSCHGDVITVTMFISELSIGHLCSSQSGETFGVACLRIDSLVREIHMYTGFWNQWKLTARFNHHNTLFGSLGDAPESIISTHSEM